jgi:hypothetical protein
VLHLTVDDAGAIAGGGEAELTSGPDCPFVTGQPQLRRFDVSVSGARRGERLELSLTASSTGNGIDYGGFGTVFASDRTLSAAISGGTASVHHVDRVVPADPTDVSIARNAVRLRQTQSSS